MQEAIRNAQSSKVISEYSSEVKEYFTRLAEMYQGGIFCAVEEVPNPAAPVKKGKKK